MLIVKLLGYLDSMIFTILFLRFLVLVSIEKTNETHRAVFDHISKHLEACQKIPLIDVVRSLVFAKRFLCNAKKN